MHLIPFKDLPGSGVPEVDALPYMSIVFHSYCILGLHSNLWGFTTMTSSPEFSPICNLKGAGGRTISNLSSGMVAFSTVPSKPHSWVPPSAPKVGKHQTHQVDPGRQKNWPRIQQIQHIQGHRIATTLWWTYKKQWKMAIEIVDFPSYKMGGSFHCYVSSPEGISH